MPKSQTTSDLNEAPPNIFEAIKSGDINSVKEALRQGVEVNKKDSNGTPPLYLASQNGHIEIVTLLLDKDANPDLQDNDKWAPLHTASENGHIEIVNLLLESNATPNLQSNNGYPPLYFASYRGHKEIVNQLLEKGANPNLQSNDGHLPLNGASQYGFQEIVNQLLDKGANPNLQSKVGHSPLHLSSFHGHKKIVERLLENGANPDLKDKEGCSPLYRAKKNGHKEIVNLLLDKKAYSEQRLNRNKINKLWKHQPKLIYAEVKFLVEHVAVMNLWLTCKEIYATEYTTEQTGHWINLPQDTKKTIIGFLASNERTTQQLDDLYKKMTANWKSEELSERAFLSRKLFVETLFTDYLETWGQFHKEAAQNFLDKGVRAVTSHTELSKNVDTFYKTFNGAPQKTGTMKALTTVLSFTKKETAANSNNTAKQTEQPQDKWKQQRTGYDSEGRFFQKVVTVQHKINGIDSLTLEDEKGKKFTPILKG